MAYKNKILSKIYSSLLNFKRRVKVYRDIRSNKHLGDDSNKHEKLLGMLESGTVFNDFQADYRGGNMRIG